MSILCFFNTIGLIFWIIALVIKFGIVPKICMNHINMIDNYKKDNDYRNAEIKEIEKKAIEKTLSEVEFFLFIAGAVCIAIANGMKPEY